MSGYEKISGYIQGARDAIEDAADGLEKMPSAASRAALVRDLVQLELEVRALREKVRNDGQVPAGN